MPVVPPVPRFKTDILDSNVTHITIPSRKNWFLILFLGFWLIGWAFGEIAVMGMLLVFVGALLFGTSLDTSSSFASFGWLFMLIWLGGWTVGGGFALYTWLWNIAGKEVIEASSVSISIAKKVWFISRPKEYEASYIQSLRLSPPIQSTWSPFGRTGNFWGSGQGVIVFDYGAQTVRFGSGLDEAEAKMILAEITQRYPQYLSRTA